MADGIDFDFSEILKLADNLGRVPKAAGPFINSAIQKTAVDIKKQVAAKLVGPWRGLAPAVDYEIKTGTDGGANLFEIAGATLASSSPANSITAEVGYNKGIAGGAAGNLREFGAPNATAHVLVNRGGKTQAIPIPGNPLKPLPPHNDLANALEENQADFEHGLDLALKDAEREAGL